MKHLILIYLAVIIQLGNLYINLDNVAFIDAEKSIIYVHFNNNSSYQILRLSREYMEEFDKKLSKYTLNLN